MWLREWIECNRSGVKEVTQNSIKIKEQSLEGLDQVGNSENTEKGIHRCFAEQIKQDQVRVEMLE